MKQLPRLTEAEITSLSDQFSALAVPGDAPAYQRWHAAIEKIPCVLEAPLGEITNPDIAGFVWAWGIQSAIETCRIEKADRFDAQGLEGKLRVHVALTTAVLVWRELPPHRRQIRADRAQVRRVLAYFAPTVEALT